jgi:hypothetical protein
VVMTMSRYSDEQRQDVLAMIRETLQHVDAALSDRSQDQVSDDAQIRQVVRFDEPPPKDRERWRREASEQEERFARERAARARNMQLAQASTAAIYEQRIAKVEAQLLSVVRAMGKVTDNVEAELRELQQESTEARQANLETKLAEALLQISQLCETVAADCRNILDLPPVRVSVG